jgi:hypothetical protein
MAMTLANRRVAIRLPPQVVDFCCNGRMVVLMMMP